MMKNRVLHIILLFIIPIIGFSQIPSYYNGIDFSQNGEDLQDDLTSLITVTHTTWLPYTSSSTDTWDAVRLTDEYTDDTKVYLFYGYDDSDGVSKTDYTRAKNLSCHTSGCIGLWTREHVYAKSRATPSLETDDPGSGTDVHNLRACDSQMNSSRGNRLFEDGSGDSHLTASSNWYPGDEWKGDVARIIMYMHLRYTSQCPANDIGIGTNINHAEMPDLFLQWNVEDPISDYETQRNTVLETMQGNRNPFIDNPYLATKIWSGDDAEDTWGILSVDEYASNGIMIYPTVVSEVLFIANVTNSIVDIIVFDAVGKEINIPIDNNEQDIHSLKSGIYFIKIFENSNISSFKFIKK